jgi:hypothetical protein
VVQRFGEEEKVAAGTSQYYEEFSKKRSGFKLTA